MPSVVGRAARSVWIAGALLAFAVAAPASADPVLLTSQTPQGGGLVRHDVSVDFKDGLGRSGFIQITFASSFDSTSTLSLANWPDVQQASTDPTVYHLQGGTGGGSQVDVVEVARLVVPKGQAITYNAVVSRNGQNYVLVPEPAGSAAAGLCLLLVAGLRARRASRPPA